MALFCHSAMNFRLCKPLLNFTFDHGVCFSSLIRGDPFTQLHVNKKRSAITFWSLLDDKNNSLPRGPQLFELLFYIAFEESLDRYALLPQKCSGCDGRLPSMIAIGE